MCTRGVGGCVQTDVIFAASIAGYGLPHIYYMYMYSGTSELGTPKGLRKTVLNSEVVLLLRSISVY